ncbi:cytochrome c, 1 heme-binding site [Citrifermentans bemidjiense Bem]|uniref:Cytochrome c, 1 heme-binding site n=1 Tax=Citrifermentans bemidjiense (strain ATCC BAA-1014 / DSM 16622 / JCM 12645 / Bem) TaxID=404380 RepID=B5EHT6_CITBB|nr:cytochrome P460 family protein [Citrifermentans bemidjiense]ACH39735.1 cytochrome c, 1 heme-binding site [Citrifermentans bemidjiense Bem]
MKKAISLMVLGAILGVTAAAAAGQTALPKGYEKWDKSKARIDTDKKSLFYGIHYIYVDKKAMKSYKSGGAYPDGSRFVAVNYSIKEENGNKVPGKKNMIVVMQKDRKEQQTGGWRFAGFTPDGKPSGLDGKRDCFGCHEKDAKGRDYVISRYADFK